jgi:type I restriction enzyme S subunit
VVIPLPPLKEQQRIVETVDQLMDECDTLEEQQEREHALQVQVGTAATEALRSADDAEALRPAWERVHEHFDTVTATPEGVDALRQTILQLAVQGRLTERNTEDKPASELVRKSSVEIQELYDSGKITKPSERPTVREEEKVFDLPDKWTWTRLGNVLALVNGRAYKESELLDEGTPVIRIQNLTGGGSWYYTDLDLPPEKYCNTGDLLYTWSGTFGPHIWDGGKAVFHYHIWRIELTTGLTKQFAYHLLQAISADVEEDAHGIMLPHMTKGGMEKHPVPLPPLAEQKRIVETLDRLLPLFDRLSENVCDKSKRGEQLLEAALSDVAEDSPDQMPAQVAS